MILHPLAGLVDALIGLPLGWVVAIGGLFALLMGVVARVHRERRRDPSPSIDRLLEHTTTTTAPRPSTDGGVTLHDSVPGSVTAPAPKSSAAVPTPLTAITRFVHGLYTDGRRQLLPVIAWVRDSVPGSTASPARRQEAEAAESTDRVEASQVDPMASGDQSDAESFESNPALRAAIARLARGQHPGTIEAAYTYARRQLAEEIEIDTPGTHWDFVERCKALDRDVDGLNELTEVYERALFSQNPIDREHAERALELAVQMTRSS